MYLMFKVFVSMICKSFSIDCSIWWKHNDVLWTTKIWSCEKNNFQFVIYGIKNVWLWMT